MQCVFIVHVMNCLPLLLEDNDAKPVKKEDIHAPAANLTEIKKTEKLREKMEQIKEKRKLNQKLG